MNQDHIKQVNKAIRINKQEIERIRVRLSDNNRSIKQLLCVKEGEGKCPEIKDLLKFNRFLFQKQREKQVVRQNLEDAFKALLLTEADQEHEWIEMEKRMECFRMTVNKCIQFNESHPYFNDQSFLLELMAEFESREDFEACAMLAVLAG
jgi:DNA mismatch repair ATPase MutS